MPNLLFVASQQAQTLGKKDIFLLICLLIVVLVIGFTFLGGEGEKVKKKGESFIGKAVIKNPPNVLRACILYVYKEIFSVKSSKIKKAVFGELEAKQMSAQELADFIERSGKTEEVVGLIPSEILKDFAIFFEDEQNETKDDKIVEEDGKNDQKKKDNPQ